MLLSQFNESVRVVETRGVVGLYSQKRLGRYSRYSQSVPTHGGYNLGIFGRYSRYSWAAAPYGTGYTGR